jgi:DNA repair protein RadC
VTSAPRLALLATPMEDPGLAAARRGLLRLGADQIDDARLLGIALAMRNDRAQQAAAALLERLGGVAAVARASAAELATVRGIGPSRATALAAAFELARRATRVWPEPSWTVRAPADIADQLLPVMGPLEREELRILLLNTKNVVQAMRTVYVGNLAGSSVRVGELYRDAVRCLAAGVVVVHNHPSGDPTPSADDLRITSELAEAGRLLDIALLDHLVIGARGWVSLRSLGAL